MPADIIKSEEIGAIIRKRRRELGVSQEQLAEKVGVSYQQIQRYENGNSMLNVENVQKIAKALSVPILSLFEPGCKQLADEPVALCSSSEERALLKNFRELSAKSDKQLAISLIRRIARK